MKKWLWLAGLGVAAAAWAAEPFSQRVTPGEFKAAGLSKLTPEELAQLDALFGKYREMPGTAGPAQPLVTSVPATMPEAASARPVEPPAAVSSRQAESAGARQAEINAAATAQAAVRVAEAEARARKAEQEAAAAREAAQLAKAEQKKAEEGFLAKAKKVLVSPGTKIEVAAIETEIDGDFTGWEEMTMWRMKDGSMWRVDNRPQPYPATRVKNPKVRIYPASLSGYWLEFVDIDLKIRVRPLK